MSALTTPCPVPGIRGAMRRPRMSACPPAADDTLTSEIEYTRALSTPHTFAPPRRKSTFFQRRETSASIPILEDVPETHETSRLSSARAMPGQPRPLGGRTLLSRPAQKIPMRRMSVVMEKQEESASKEPKATSLRRPRESILPTTLFYENTTLEADQRTKFATPNPNHASALQRNPRRRTIYVPSDDTTVMTIHPGAYTTDRLNDTFQIPELESTCDFDPTFKTTPIIPDQRQALPKKPRSSLAAAPKRLPLQPTSARRDNLPSVDIPGQNGGKENMPPHHQTDKKDVPTLMAQPTCNKQSIASKARRRSIFCQPTKDALSKQPSQNTRKRAAPTSHLEQIASPPRMGQGPLVTCGLAQRALETRSSSTMSTNPPTQTSRSKTLQYPVLAENVSQPELYEDNWLSHQEVALTELLNQIFANFPVHPPPPTSSAADRRKAMVEVFHQPMVTTMHKRLQASLLYGALCRPKDLPKTLDPAHDLGLRRRFMTLWLDNYTHDALRTAAEVVVGRRLPPTPSDSSTSGVHSDEALIDPRREQQALIGFIETFFIFVHDADEGDAGEDGLDGQRLRKMIMRSLMLIWLLDQSKTHGIVSGRLYKSSSTKKSSAIILASFASIFFPWVGDIARTLRHLDYEVCSAQNPLDEVDYRIQNIAIDLRDGVFLTRLTEILLLDVVAQSLPSERQSWLTQMPLDPLIQTLCSANNISEHRFLSKDLKMPCLGRVQRLHNVQIALDGLQSYQLMSTVKISFISAEDVVDGHRENTLRLLWSLISHHGLASLVDWRELAADMRRLEGTRNMDSSAGHSERPVSNSTCESMLEAWAKAHGAQSGLLIDNLTTCFADGRAYAAILNGFAECFAQHSLSRPLTSSRGNVLGDHLHALGCSAAFIAQLCSPQDTIPAKMTVVSNLAFLASRLLPTSRASRAARTIQCAVRRWLNARTITRRIVLLRLAHSCAAVVQERQRNNDAATVLQRAWRRILDTRISRLHNEVTKFQSHARRWLSCHHSSLPAGYTGSHRTVSGW